MGAADRLARDVRDANGESTSPARDAHGADGADGGFISPARDACEAVRAPLAPSTQGTGDACVRDARPSGNAFAHVVSSHDISSRATSSAQGTPLRVLLAEDDPAIVSGLADYLASEGFSVRSTPTQDGALELLRRERFDVALVDIGLAQGTGFAVCAAAKAAPDGGVPVIFVTAANDEFTTVAGLDMGADDYIAKPFRPRELLSRIRSVLRRTGRQNPVLELGDVRLDTARGVVTKAGREVFLSALEYRLLLTFMNAPGRLLTRSQLAEAIWDAAGEYVEDNTLSVYVKRLRDKIEDDPSSPRLITTVRGMGYRVAQ